MVYSLGFSLFYSTFHITLLRVSTRFYRFPSTFYPFSNCAKEKTKRVAKHSWWNKTNNFITMPFSFPFSPFSKILFQESIKTVKPVYLTRICNRLRGRPSRPRPLFQLLAAASVSSESTASRVKHQQLLLSSFSSSIYLQDWSFPFRLQNLSRANLLDSPTLFLSPSITTVS